MKGLISEISERYDAPIIKAINKGLKVTIIYDDENPHNVRAYNGEISRPTKGKRKRTILPVCYGNYKGKGMAVRAWQEGGSTRRGKPHWKLFYIDKMYRWINSKEKFIKPYGDFLKANGLNVNGDDDMYSIKAISPLCSGNVEVDSEPSPIKTGPITKNDIKQEPNTQQTATPNEKTKEPAIFQHPTSIDNTKANAYPINRTNAPETEPITKTDLSPDNGDVEEPESTSNQEENPITEPNETTPVTKQDIVPDNNGEEEDNEENKEEEQQKETLQEIRNTFNNWMKRMENLYND